MGCVSFKGVRPRLSDITKFVGGPLEPLEKPRRQEGKRAFGVVWKRRVVLGPTDFESTAAGFSVEGTVGANKSGHSGALRGSGLN